MRSMVVNQGGFPRRITFGNTDRAPNAPLAPGTPHTIPGVASDGQATHTRCRRRRQLTPVISPSVRIKTPTFRYLKPAVRGVVPSRSDMW
jgi:hypothetical protein